MKRLSILLILIISFSSIYAQEMNSSNVLRTGAALVLRRHDNYKGKNKFFPGIQYQLEYSRKFASYFSLDATLYKSDIKYSSLNHWSDVKVPHFTNAGSYGVSAKGIFTPFKAIKWLKIGVGGYAEYSIAFNSVSNYEESIYRRRNMFYGINVPLRFYIIDSNKFDLYAYYEYTARIDGSSYSKDTFYFLHDVYGLMFGVKF